MEQVAHGVDKDTRRAFAPQWFVETLGPQRYRDTLLVWVATDSKPPFGKCACVAVVAAGTHLRAARHEWTDATWNPVPG